MNFHSRVRRWGAGRRLFGRPLFATGLWSRRTWHSKRQSRRGSNQGSRPPMRRPTQRTIDYNSLRCRNTPCFRSWRKFPLRDTFRNNKRSSKVQDPYTSGHIPHNTWERARSVSPLTQLLQKRAMSLGSVTRDSPKRPDRPWGSVESAGLSSSVPPTPPPHPARLVGENSCLLRHVLLDLSHPPRNSRSTNHQTFLRQKIVPEQHCFPELFHFFLRTTTEKGRASHQGEVRVYFLPRSEEPKTRLSCWVTMMKEVRFGISLMAWAPT